MTTIKDGKIKITYDPNCLTNEKWLKGNRIKKNPKWMDECFQQEPCYELPKKKKSKRGRVEADKDFDIGV